MRSLTWHFAVSGWLLFSAFALGHSPGAAALTALLAVLIGTFAFAAAGLPPLRFVNVALALVLGWGAVLMVDSSGLARVNNAIVAAIVFALAIVPGRAHGSPSVQPPPI